MKKTRNKIVGLALGAALTLGSMNAALASDVPQNHLLDTLQKKASSVGIDPTGKSVAQLRSDIAQKVGGNKEQRLTTRATSSVEWADDQQANATPLALGTSKTGFLGDINETDADETDWLKITTTQGGALTIKFTPKDNLYVYFSLYNADEQEVGYAVADASSGDTGQIVCSSLPPGTYYLQISRSYGTGSYTVSNQFTPKVDPDNGKGSQMETAQDLPLDTAKTGQLGYYIGSEPRNESWFKVTLPKKGDLSISATTDEQFGVDIWMAEGDGKTEITSEYVEGEKKDIVGHNLEAGTYYVRVSRFDETVEGKYTIQASFARSLVPELAGYKQWATKSGVASNKEWRITFSQPVNPNTINGTNIRVISAAEKDIPVQVSLATDGRTVIVKAPMGGYASGDAYALLIGDGVMSSEEAALNEPIQMNFTIK